MSLGEKYVMGMTSSPEKIEKKEKKTHSSAVKFVGAISFVAFIIMIGTFTTTIITTITTSQAYAQTNYRRAVNEIIPVEGTVTSTECTNGETIELNGNVHLVGRVVVDETGGHVVGHVNFQGVRGDGLTTGNDYRVPYAFDSTTDFNIRFDTTQGSATETTAFELISKGPSKSAPNLLVHAQFHFTINANGKVTAEIVNLIAECR